MQLRFDLGLRVPVLLLLALPVWAADGAAEAPFRFYTVQDGLTQSEVVDIEQDQAGYLWFTTARGLNRYDGIEFDQFTIADGLPHNSLTAVHIGADNSVWVGDARGGVTFIQGSRLQQSIAPLDIAAAPVLAIESVGERTFAVIEGAGIVEVLERDGVFMMQHIVGSEAQGITNLAVHRGQVWVESQTGLYRLEYESEAQLGLLSEGVRRIHADTMGTLWVADRSGAVGVWRDDTFVALATIDSDNEIVSIVTDRDEIVWIATSSELFSINGREPGSSRATGIPKKYVGVDDVTSLFVDRENSLWLASGSRLIRFLGDRFRQYRLRSGFDSETVWSIAQDHVGRMWFGTESKLLMRRHDDSVLVVDKNFGIPKGTVRDIVSDDSGYLWIGITDKGLYRFDVDAMRASHIIESGDVKILDVAVAADGAVWYSTVGSGVFRYQPDERLISRFEAPDSTSVYSLDIAADGSVWYGADEVGLVRLVPGPDGTYEQQVLGAGAGRSDVASRIARLRHGNDGGYVREFLNSDGGLPKRLFNHVRVTDNDSAWIATEEGGLYRFENNTFSDFGEITPLTDQTVYLVEPLANGTVIVGGEQGLYQFIPGTPGIAHYNQQVGFIGLETNVHATFFDSSGYLWIGTVDGASRMDTTRPLPDAPVPTPTIVHMETQLGAHPIVENGEVSARQLGARVEFAAISLLNPRGVEYSYMLDGVDSDWGSPTTSRSVSYPRIPPGSYKFIVRARHPGGQWSSEAATRQFTVLPFFWQQTWFVFAVLVLGLVGLRAFMMYRTRNIEWLNETLRAQVEERTQSIEQARRKLVISNERLSTEVNARAEVETRFRRAFENAPIGMGLLDAEGVLFDANPALRRMLWPGSETLPPTRIIEIISEKHRQQFSERYEHLISSRIDHLEERLDCITADDAQLHTVVNLSSVRSDSGEFLYSVLQIQDVTESLKLNVQLEYQASYDELTGLLNRRAFESQLQRAWDSSVESKKSSYLMFMDLDQFKVVNDTSGHTAGDQLLRGISEILVSSVRNDDIVGRLGGDEFGIILWECPTEIAKRIAESIRESVEKFRFHWDVETYRVGVSIGGLPIDPAVGDISELQQLADAACYAAKEAGRNRVHMVSGEKDSARIHRGQVRWVQRLREAMEKNRFAIYGQLIKPIQADTGEPERIEILLRLREPETRKLIPPGAFLPAAERYGLSIELDKWVIHSLFDMLFVHHAFDAAHRKYWINLSGSSVGDRRFAEYLMEAVKKSPLPPGTINFEITENAVIRSISEASELMSSLREMGCQFALDDFGSGLSSYGYLKKLPVDYVKIDGSFIRNLMNDKTDRIFFKSIIEIAHTMNIKTIAEFVEDDKILAAVRELGADYGQGFAIGKPFVFAPRFPHTADADGAGADFQAHAG